MKQMTTSRVALFVSAFVLPITSALATSNYEYGRDEYVTVATGISPNGQYAITAHGGGNLGYDNFHLYLTDVRTGKNFGPLSEIIETLDTGANAFSAKWSGNSKNVIIIYRVDRHAPLKAVKYRIVGRRASWIKGPFNVTGEELAKYWRDHSSGTAPSPKIFGASLHRR